jgi:hypothetical protein
MRPCNNALRLSETVADGASASTTSLASVTRTFFSSNSSWWLSPKRRTTPSTRTCKPAASSAIARSMG